MNQTKFTAVLLILALSIITGCGGGGSKKPPAGKGSISGQIVSSSGLSVYKAKVSIGKIETQTDREGNFALTGLPTGNQKLVIEKNGYQKQENDVAVTESVTNHNITLQPNSSSATIKGEVTFE